MILVNTFFNPVSMHLNDNQGETLVQSSRKLDNSFENVLKDTSQEKSAKSAERDNQIAKYIDDKNVEQKTRDAVQTQKPEENNTNQSSEVKDKSDSDQKIAKKDNKDEKNNSQEDKFSMLGEKDKAVIKEVADKLDIKPEALINLLQSLNIDFKSLIQSSANVEQVLQKITTAVESGVEKLNLNPTVMGNKDIRAKIQLLVNQQKHDVLKVGTDNKDVNPDLKVNNDKTQMEVQASDIKTSDNSDNKAATAEVQPQVHTKGQGKDEKIEIGNQLKVDVSQELGKKDTMQKSDRGSEEKASNQQTPQETGKGIVKNNDTIDMQTVLNNVKVINLKTVQKEGQSTENLKVDSQNAFPMQGFEGLANKVIPLKQAIQNISSQKDNIFSQIIENAKLTLTDKQTEMEMNLKPENLGKLSIKIASENGLIMAKITTESEQVKAVIESNLSQLKEQLQQQGLSIQDFSVSVGQDQRQQLFSNQKSNSNGAKLHELRLNSVAANESYADRIMVKNPYLMSDSSIDYTA